MANYFQNKGFGLVEAMIAIGILGLIISLFMQSNAIQNFTMKNDRITEKTGEVCNLIFNKFKEEFESQQGYFGLPRIVSTNLENNSILVENFKQLPYSGDIIKIFQNENEWTVANSNTNPIILEENLDTEFSPGSKLQIIKSRFQPIDDLRILDLDENGTGDSIDLNLSNDQINALDIEDKIKLLWINIKTIAKNLIGEASNDNQRLIKIICDEDNEGKCENNNRKIYCEIGNQSNLQRYIQIIR